MCKVPHDIDEQQMHKHEIKSKQQACRCMMSKRGANLSRERVHQLKCLCYGRTLHTYAAYATAATAKTAAAEHALSSCSCSCSCSSCSCSCSSSIGLASKASSLQTACTRNSNVTATSPRIQPIASDQHERIRARRATKHIAIASTITATTANANRAAHLDVEIVTQLVAQTGLKSLDAL